MQNDGLWLFWDVICMVRFGYEYSDNWEKMEVNGFWVRVDGL